MTHVTTYRRPNRYIHRAKILKRSDLLDILKQKKIVATECRISILDILAKEHRPLSIAEITSRSNSSFDKVTAYRNTENFVRAGIAHRIDRDKNHVLYELSVDRPHHHHVVCTDCGFIEDVAGCRINPVEKLVGRVGSSKFAIITDHSLEFSGICRTCNGRRVFGFRKILEDKRYKE